MTPTAELVTKLRLLIGERVPPAGAASDTLFSDEELQAILTSNNTVEAAAAEGWTTKAGLLEAKIESYKVGQETYDYSKLSDEYKRALQMATFYAGKADKADPAGGAVMLKVSRPRVAGIHQHHGGGRYD